VNALGTAGRTLGNEANDDYYHTHTVCASVQQ
jgi:hypothetical protein